MTLTPGCVYGGDAHPDPARLYAAGNRFVLRDVDDLAPEERDALHTAGLSIGLVAAHNMRAEPTFDDGARDATRTAARAVRVGAPAGVPIYFAVPSGVTSGQWPAVAAYLDGAASVIGLGRLGILGGFRAMQWAARDGVASWFFQRADDTGQWYIGNHLEEHTRDVAVGGAVVNLCRAIQDQWGQWAPPGRPPVPEDDKMKQIWYVELGDGRIGRDDGTFVVVVGESVHDPAWTADVWKTSGRWQETAPMACDGPWRMNICNPGLHMNAEPYLTLMAAPIGEVYPPPMPDPVPGPEGPAGPQGKVGPAGPPGQRGEPGLGLTPGDPVNITISGATVA